MSNTFEFAEKFGFESPFEFENTTDKKVYRTGVVNWDSLPNKLNKSSFILNERLLVGQKSFVTEGNKSLEEYLFNRSKKNLSRIFIEDSVDKKYKDKYSLKALISTQYNKTLSKNKAIYSYSIDIEDDFFRYRVVFPFNSKSDNDRLPDKYGVIIEAEKFEDLEALLMDINLEFEEKEKKRIIAVFDKAFKSAGDDINKFDALYEIAPQFVIESRGINILVKDLHKLLTGWVDTRGTNEELAVLKMVKALHKVSKSNEQFLNLFLEKFEEDETLLSQILYRLDDENANDFIYFILAVWEESPYNKRDHVKFTKSNGPAFLPYRSNTAFGFYVSNASANYNAETNIVEVSYSTGQYTYVDYPHPDFPGETFSVPEEIIKDYEYHPFFPIDIPSKQKGEIKIGNRIPGFFLHVKENKDFWNNVYFGGELLLDFITTFSGVGNVLKFRHLISVAKRASKLRFASKAAKVAKVKAAVKAVAAVVEISSGTINALLKLSENNNTELGRDISQFLFYLELLSLSGELTDAIKTSLQKRSRKILSDKSSLEGKLDELVESGDVGKGDRLRVIDEIEEIAQVNRQKLANNGKTPKFSVIKPKVRKYWMSFLQKRGVKFEIGTEKAKKILEKEEALGLHVTRLKNIERYEFEQTIYLYENPSTSTFLEECYHALQQLDGLPKYMEPITVRGVTYSNVNAWEYLAKKRVLDEATRNGITYEEYRFIEDQLQEVLENKYDY